MGITQTVPQRVTVCFVRDGANLQLRSGRLTLVTHPEDHHRKSLDLPTTHSWTIRWCAFAEVDSRVAPFEEVRVRDKRQPALSFTLRARL